ncbi:glucosamine--fructose-6-phosphate aminotransferase (isomerizing) [Chelatococcus caeni]|uniref:Glucosamine--fructose-6-phosphate aminotransferase (Isomerizing) n=2 Tax=Chelatococcus caeni TaxID=1348468 RepID=A0A840BZG1_9HYPH|nr:glucosamine--fructose-6-phosphate aminotransferase (isomerizing) [Chelatococcus caeni]
MNPMTEMERETREAPQAVARLLDASLDDLAALGRRLSGMAPPVVATCARGTSDHAAGYLKYLLEIATGTPVASLGPSLASVYDAPLRLRGAVLFTISQSGQSPDIVALQAAARAAGALTVALVNVDDSPVAQAADVAIPLQAGVERSVAATKSFIAAAAAAATIVAAWAGDERLLAAIRGLPQSLAEALAADWSALEEPLSTASSCYMVGRGPALAIAQEAALKSKETAAIHAEAFSTAEIMHGPLRLVRADFPILAFLPEDRAAAAGRAALQRLQAAGGHVFPAATADAPGKRLPVAATGHAHLDPLSMAVSFYGLMEKVSRLRGFDPDRPPHLLKVTETV